MDIFVKYPDSDALHHYRTGDGEGSDAASFRANTLGGRTDVRLFDAEGVEFVDRVEDPVAEDSIAEDSIAEEAATEPGPESDE